MNKLSITFTLLSLIMISQLPATFGIKELHCTETLVRGTGGHGWEPLDYQTK